MKKYDVYCITKANGHQYLHAAQIEAKTAKDAKEAMRSFVEIETGRHAFSLTTGEPGGEWRWHKVCERLCIDMDGLRDRAICSSLDGYCFF